MDGVPEGWKRRSLSALVLVNPTEKIIKNSQIRYVPMSCLSTTGMTIEIKEIETRNISTNVKFKNGDTLLARITPCLENGKTCYVNFLNENEIACGSTEFIVLREKIISSYFIYCTSRTEKFRESAIKSMIGASGRQRVQNSCFDNFLICLPPLPLRLQFDITVKPVFQKISCLMKENSKLAAARDLLLPRLMSGEVRV